MKLKKLMRFLIYAIHIGFIFGLVKAINTISSHNYFYHKLHRLILFNLTDSINRGIIYGLIIMVFSILLIKTVSFIWLKLFSPFIEIRIIKKKKLAPLIKGFSFGLIFAYLLFQILKYARSPDHDIQFLLGHSLIVFCLFLLFLRLEKIDSKFSMSKILNFFKSSVIKITAGAILTIFVLINLLNFGQKLFNPPSGPNVLMIVADALRPDHLGCYGYDRPTSPQVNKFAAEAIIFERAMCNSSWTKPSIGTVFTSLYPHEHQAFSWLDNLNNAYLTLAEVFSEMNYTTFAIQTNPVLTKNHNFQQGFKHYKELILNKGDKVTTEFNTWLKKNKNRPFFAYLHFMDSHLPYNPPDEFRVIFEPKALNSLITSLHKAYKIRILNEIGLSLEDKQHLINLYDAEIRYFDRNFEKIIDNLKKLGIFDKTIIILTSDHGEEFWEHNGFEHGHTLYNEVLHVPLIIKYSSFLPAKRIKSFVQLLDLFPTILVMAGIKNDFGLRGRDLTSAVLNNREVNDEIFFEGILAGAEKKAVINDGWKLIENTGIINKDTFDFLGGLMKYKSSEHEKGFELYNINNDFSEKFNLINEYPQIANKLRGYLRLFKIGSFDYQKQKRTDLKKKLDDLKSLGYIK